MGLGAFNLVEPELLAAPPRPVRMTPEGGQTLLIWAVPLGMLTFTCAKLFFAQPQPGWLWTLFVVFAAGTVAMLIRLLALWRARRLLIERGTPALAVVVEKEHGRKGVAYYYAWYQAAGKEWGVGWAGEAEAAEIGETVTVLYSARNPAQAIVYRWSGCEAIPLTRA
jgi:hypothetical protein